MSNSALVAKIEEVINALNNLVVELTPEPVPPKTQRRKLTDRERFKRFFNKNFEITENSNDYITCKDLTKFCINHCSLNKSATHYNIWCNEFIKTKTLREPGNKKTHKAKRCLKYKGDIEFEFSNVQLK